MSTKYIASNWRLPNEENSGKSDNYGLSFDGTEFIDCGDSDVLSFGDSSNDYPFSISAWINMDNASNFRIVSKYDAPNYEYQFDVGSSNKLQFYIFDGSNYRGVGYDTALNTGEWYHVVATYDGSGSSSGMTLYINGLAVNDTTFSNGSYTAMHNTSATVKIGRIASSYADGKISEVAVFNYALSSTQVSTLYGSSSLGAGNPMALKPQPVAHYPLGDNSASNPLTQPNEAVEDASVFDFDLIGGVGDLISATNTLPTASDFSISLWVNPDSSQTTYSTTIVFGNLVNGENLQIVSRFGNGYFYVGNGASSYIAQSNAVQANVWTLITVTYDNTTGILTAYLNGGESVYTSSSGTTLPTQAFGNLMYIGKYTQNSTSFQGKISNVQIWNTKLSSTEVETLYNSGVPLLTGTQPQEANLKAWYKLDQSANWEADSSGAWQIPDAVSAYPQSFNFVSTNSNYIDCGTSLGNDLGTITELTVSMWIKADVTNDNDMVFNIGSFINSWGMVLIRLTYNFIYLSLNNNARYISKSYTSNDWNHVAFVYDGSDVNNTIIYINGEPQTPDGAAGTFPSSLNLTGLKTIIGAGYSTVYSYDGKLSNVQVFDTALPATGTNSIQTLYNNGTPLTTAIATDNLKAWYKLNDNEKFDDTNWEIENQKYPANYESALSFDGNSDYIDCGNGSSLSPSNFTLSVWAKSDLSNGSWISKYASENYGFGIYGGSIFLNIKTSAGWGGLSLTASSYLTANNWHHIVGTYDETDLKIYVDGNLAGTLPKAGPITYSSRDTRIGNLEGTSSLDFNGEISNAAIFNTALDSTAITALYNNGTPETSISSSPISWWKLDNTTTGIQDSVGSNNGTNNGATKVNTFVSTEAGVSSGMTEQNLVNNNVSALNGTSSGMTSANLVLSDLTRAVPYDSYSFNFDAASSDYIDCGDSDTFSFGNGSTDEAFSVSAWIKMDTITNFVVLSKYGASTSLREYAIGFSPDKIYLLLYDDNGAFRGRYYNTSTTSNDWLHIATTYNGVGGTNAQDGIKIYINGTRVDDSTYSSGSYTAMSNTTSELRIGSFSTTYADGKISNLSIFNEALTSTEVLKLYSNGVPQDLSSFTPAPVAWYPLGSNSFWNGSQWIVRDMSTGGSNDGTSQNIGVDGLVGDSPRSSAGGTATNMDVPSNLEGSTKWSDNNSWSINMSSTARVEDTP